MTSDERKKALLIKFHTICHVNGINDEHKKMILDGFNAISSKDLSIQQLLSAIDAIDVDKNRWRRRVMASIGGWLRSINREDNAQLIKAIACRACGYKDFNDIPQSRLRDVYYEFVRKAKTADKVEYIKADIIHELSNSN